MMGLNYMQVTYSSTVAATETIIVTTFKRDFPRPTLLAAEQDALQNIFNV